MIIKRLVLHNFGLYAGINTFDFESDKPVILIGGMNGRGKTTLLESVLLSLYGRRSFAFSESKLSYNSYLKKLVNTTDQTLRTYIEIEFEIGKDETKHSYRLKREWSDSQIEIKDSITVWKNGVIDSFLSDNWAMFIEEILPSAISNFFFFDGEKISELAVESTGEQMRNSIKTLLGIDVLDRLENDLNRILKNKNKKLSSSSNQKEIDSVQNKLDELELKADKLYRDIVEINTNNDTYRKNLDKLEAQFMSQGGTLGNSKTELLKKKENLENELQETNEKLIEYVSGEIPLSMVSFLLEDVLENSQKEQDSRSIQFAAMRIEELYGLFAEAKGNVNNEVNDFINFVKSSTENANDIDFIPYDLSENGYLQLKMLCNSFLHAKLEETKAMKNRRTKLKKDIDDIENYLLVEIDEVTTGTIYKKIKSLNEKIGAKEEKKKILTEQHNEISADITICQKELSKLIEKSLSELESADDTSRIVKYSHYSILVLKEYRLRLQKQKTKGLADTMTKCYKQIANKTTLISKIEINPITLDFLYYDYEGLPVAKNKLSAGEKQLMVVAMLWSLAICSNNQLPVIIDTPLARLDSAHRERIVKNYFPNASEQTIILSTDSEIDENYYKMLKPVIGKEYTLNYDDNTRSSTISVGFFGGKSR